MLEIGHAGFGHQRLGGAAVDLLLGQFGVFRVDRADMVVFGDLAKARIP